MSEQRTQQIRPLSSMDAPSVPGPDLSTGRRLVLASGGIGHQLNNALQSIIGHADLIAAGVLSPIERKTSADAIRQIGLRMSRILGKLTEFSRGLAAPLLIDLSLALIESAPELEALLPSGTELVVVPADRACPVWIDHTNMIVLFRGLLENARDAMPRGGRITMAVRFEQPRAAAGVRPAGPRAVLEVTDTGTGMDQEVLGHLYEPFFTQRPGAAGLGLASIQEVVRERGGEINVRSELGKGTRFVVWLPLAEPGSRADPLPHVVRWPNELSDLQEEAHVEAPEEPAGAGQTVLVVDDDEDISTIIQMQLTSLGYRVRTATSGLDALKILESEKIHCDLLLTDLMMPGLGGIELTERMRAARPDLPVIYMTGYLTAAIEEKIGDQPHTGYLAKPFDLGVLAQQVHALVSGLKPIAGS